MIFTNEGTLVEAPTANLFLVGAPKAGTTSLAHWLGEHPDIYWSVPKEPFYWASDYPAMRRHYGFDDQRAYDKLYESTAARNALLRGDGSTTYLYSEAAVAAILDRVAAPRFLVCVRNPVDLLVSYHRTQLVALNEDEYDFERAWRRSLEGRGPGSRPLDDKLVDYPLVGRLGAMTARLMEAAGRERVHVVVFDDLVADPSRTYRQVLEFLGVDASHAPEFGQRNPSDKTYRSAVVRRLTHRPPRPLSPFVRRLRQWARTSDSPVVAALKRSLWRAHEPPSVDPAFRRELHAHFAEDVAMLEHLLNRRLDAGGEVSE